MNSKIVPVKPYQRKFLEKGVDYRQWKLLSSFSQELIEQNIDSTEGLIDFLYKKNELDVVVLEQLEFHDLRSFRFANTSVKDSSGKKLEKDLRSNYDKTIGLLNKKILDSPYLLDLMKVKPDFRRMILNIQNQSKVYAAVNETVVTRLSELGKKYNEVNALHKISVNDEEVNLFKAASAVKDEPRTKRREIDLEIEECREKHSPVLDKIFGEMVAQRHLLAEQAGYENYRDFIWDEKSRVDYTPKDCENICSAIETHFIPLQKETIEKRKHALGLEDIYSYDLQTDLGSAPSMTFPKNQKEILVKVRRVFNSIHPDFSKAIDYLIKEERLDFEARPNKVSAMFTTYFPESKQPFVFYTPTNTMHDVHAPIHELTHAIHCMYCNQYSLIGLQNPGAEVSELFTLSMELISSEYWNVYFEDEQNLIRSKMKKLENCLGLLRMIGLWDGFQRWAYLNPKHNTKERNFFWDDLSKRFDIGITSTSIKPAEENTGWQHRPLIYFAPFYMMEYAFAQFGAFEIYRQYREEPTQTINKLIAAMKLGNTKSIQEIYKVAGVEFNFSNAYIKRIADFVRAEYNELFEQLRF